MEGFVYRTLKEEKVGEKIVCKNPNSVVSLFRHVLNGSNEKSKFLSMTKRIGIAANKYLVRYNSKAKTPQKGHEKRRPVVVIDLSKLKHNIYDCSSLDNICHCGDEEMENKAKNYNNSTPEDLRALHYALADREIITEYEILPEAYKEVNPILVDVLDAVERVAHFKLSKAYEQRKLNGTPKGTEDNAKILLTLINKMIMNDEENELIDIINNLDFEPFENLILENYYNQMLNAYETAKVFKEYIKEDDKEGDKDALYCVFGIKTNIIRKILGNPKIQEKLYKNAKDTMSEKEFERVLQEAQEYYAIQEGLISSKGKEKDYKDEKKEEFYPGDGLSIKVKVKDPMIIPIGVRNEKEQKAFVLQYRVLKKETGYDDSGRYRTIS